MSGFPVNSILAKITSWTAGGSEDTKQLVTTATNPVEMTLNYESDIQDITPMDGAQTATSSIGGLNSATIAFSGYWPKAANVLGNTGLLTLGSSFYSFCVQSWNLRGEWGEEDITSFPAEAAGTSGASRRYMPSGLLKWSGSFTALTASGLALSLPTGANGAGVSAVFKMKECGAADASFTGNIVVKSASQVVPAGGGKVMMTYQFQGSGDLTSVAGTTGGPAILPAGVLNLPDWDTNSDGVPDNILTAQTYTGRTIVGPAFLREFSVDCNVGQPVKVSGTGRMSDSWTLA